MHDEVKRFPLDGEIVDSGNLVTAKERLVNFVETQMRDEGYVPVLDLEPQFTLDYNLDTEGYSFKLSVYGVHVGKEGAWQSAGMMNGKMITKPTHRVRLKES
jgi:hypothetical protein